MSTKEMFFDRRGTLTNAERYTHIDPLTPILFPVFSDRKRHWDVTPQHQRVASFQSIARDGARGVQKHGFSIRGAWKRATRRNEF